MTTLGLDSCFLILFIDLSLIESLLNPNLDVEIIIENSKRLSDVINIIDKKSFRWLELDELM